MFFRALFYITLGLSLSSTNVRAAFPDRAINLVVAYGAGTTDSTARALAPVLSRQLGGVEVRVTDVPGAGGEFGFSALAEAPSDGYTIGFLNLPAAVTIPIERNTRFTIDSFDPLVGVVVDPSVWSVRADGPLTRVTALLAAARERPGTVTVATSGVGSDDHLSLIRVQKLARVKLVHVPFTGSDAAARAVLDGKIAVVAQNLAEALRLRETGRLRILAVMSRERSPEAPDVPTFKELGLNVEMASTRVVAAPRGLAPDVRGRLVDALARAIVDPDFVVADGDTARLRVMSAEESRELPDLVRSLDRELRERWVEEPWNG